MINDYQGMKNESEVEQILEPKEMLRTIYEYSIKYAIKHPKETKFYLRYTLFTPTELKKDNSVIVQMFQDIEPSFLSIVNGAEGFQQGIESEEQDSYQLDADFNEVIENETIFLEQMDAIVCRYEADARESVQHIEITHSVLFLLIIAILIFIAIKIFIPLLNYLKNAFLRVNESNKNLIKMFQTMKGALFVIKKDGEIFFMNGDAEKIASNEKGTKEVLYLATSVNWIEFDIRKLIEKKSDDSRIENIETKIEDKDGNILSVLISAVSGSYNGYEAVMLNLFDVTAQKKAEESLKTLLYEMN